MGQVSRRDFLATSTVAAGTLLAAPRFALGAQQRPLRVAVIGVGNRAGAQWGPLRNYGCEIAILCDVDENMQHRHKQNALENKTPAEAFPNAKFYKDYREIFARPDEFDVVVINTPDHTHFYPAMAAIKAGKPVFCEKPLTWSFEEATLLGQAAQQSQVVTQMGNQGMSTMGWRVAYGFITDGAIGDLQEVHAWRSHDPSLRHYYIMGDGIPKRPDKVPAGLDWDLWLGPAADQPYYNGLYHPYRWRAWLDFGSGMLGDWVCHIFNALYKIYGVSYPSIVECIGRSHYNGESWPMVTKLRYHFAADGSRPAFDAYWYDGDQARPPRPPELEADRELPDAGLLVRGTDGLLIVAGGHNNSAYLIPNSRNKEFGRPKSIPQKSIGHMREFLEAASGKTAWDAPLSNFMYGAPLTQLAHLGNAAVRLKAKLKFDPQTLRFTNSIEANRYLTGRTPREGFAI